MARIVYEQGDSDDDTPTNNQGNIDHQLEAQSRELYSNFLREEILSHGLTVPSDVTLFEGSNQFSNPLWLCNATNLRQLANEFSNSPLRHQVRLRAQSVDLLTLNSQSFREMIQEIFSGGTMTRERILVVFFFCSDVALFALQNHSLQVFSHLITWSTEYITGKLTRWVHEQGGWGSILNTSVNTLLKISATTACFVAAFAMIVFIRKNWN